MRMHIGSGTVYLRDWVNVDVPTENCFLASERPDLVELWGTTEAEGYYARHEKKSIDEFRKGARVQEYVCDRFGTFSFLPAPPGTVKEVLARQSFEHLSKTEARAALKSINTVMEPLGILRLDVPDNDETLRLLMETKDPFYIRHFLGPRKGDYGKHCVSYTKDELISLVQNYGFSFLKEERNIHLYPAFTLRFEKCFDWAN